MKRKRMAALLLGAAMVVGLAGCGDAASEGTTAPAETAAKAPETTGPAVVESAASAEPAASTSSEVTEETEPEIDYNALVKDYEVDFSGLTFDFAKWSYDADNDVYYQIGVQYCSQPAALDYETLAVVVPGAYLTGTDNGDGTYTCAVNPDGTINGFTAETAPMMLPVNTAGYSAQAAATSYSYSSVSAYLDAGYVYVYSGCRGRSNGYNDDGTLAYAGGAPWGVTDLKAAVRYLRLNNDAIPGDPERIFAFGHSGGGAQSAVLGTSGACILTIWHPSAQPCMMRTAIISATLSAAPCAGAPLHLWTMQTKPMSGTWGSIWTRVPGLRAPGLRRFRRILPPAMANMWASWDSRMKTAAS